MTRLALPYGWYAMSPETARPFGEELQRELALQHVLRGVNVEAVARRHDRDDVLFRRVGADSYVLVHLTWRGSQEGWPDTPRVQFDGSFAEFVEHDRQHEHLDPDDEDDRDDSERYL